MALADGQLALAAVPDEELDAPREQDVQRVARRALLEDRLAAPKRLDPQQRREPRQLPARVAAKEGHALQQLHRQLDARRLRVDRQPVTAQCVASICRNSHRSVAITLASRRSVSGDCRPASAAWPKPTDVPGAPCSGAVGESSAGDYCSLPDSVVTLTVPASSTQNESCGLVSRSTTE